MTRFMKTIMIMAGTLAVITTIFIWPLRYVAPGFADITWQPLSGEIGLLHTGWNVVGPLTFTTEIDTRPQRLCLSSDTHAAANCRLVQFDITRVNDFVATEGWRWYWWSNRLSFNAGYDETYRGFRDVLRGYAFSANQYPFVKVLKQ